MTFDRLILILLFLFFLSLLFGETIRQKKGITLFDEVMAVTFGWIKAGKAAGLGEKFGPCPTPNSAVKSGGGHHSWADPLNAGHVKFLVLPRQIKRWPYPQP